MEIVYATIAIIVGYIIIKFIIIPWHSKKTIYSLLTNIANDNNFTIEKKNRKPYKFKLITPTITLYIDFIIVPKYSTVTINSFRTWRLSWGNKPIRAGKTYPHTRYLNELKDFLSFTPNAQNGQKVVIIYKRTERLLMYINESELKFVTSKDRPHNLKVIEFRNLESNFDDLLQ